MDRPRIYGTEAIVLKDYDYGEADRILTLYTPNHGKVRAIAKGIRKTKSRKAGHLDLFTRSNLLLARGRQLDIITQAETIELFGGMRNHLWRSANAHYVAELVDSFTVEAMGNLAAYALTIATLRRLAEAGHLDLIVRSFELQLLNVSGYRPQLHTCLGCSTSIVPAHNRFSPKLGGILCPLCATADAAATLISVDALKVLRNLQTNEHAVFHAGGPSEQILREVEARMREYITYRLESRPRSATFLDRLRTEGVADEMRLAEDTHVS